MKNTKKTIISVIPESSFGGISGIYKILKEKLFNRIQGRFLLSQEGQKKKEGQNNNLKTKDYQLKTTSSNSLSFYKLSLGFTLVELIVVITILAILGTIAFVSFGSYSSSARDSKRISNLSLLDKGFGIAIAGGKTINTSESLSGSEYNIFINGSGLTLSGVFDSPIKPKLLMSLGITSEELSVSDPTNYYKYTYIPSTRQYQVMVSLENKPGTSYFIGGLQKIFAEDTSSSSYPFIKGNYTETGSIVGLIPKIEPVLGETYTLTGTIDYMITTDSVIETSETSTPTGSGCIFDNADSKFDSCTFSL